MEDKTSSKTRAIVESTSAVMAIIPRCPEAWGVVVWFGLTISRFETLDKSLAVAVWGVVTTLLIGLVGWAVRRELAARHG
jgi:hypothetical protein